MRLNSFLISIMSSCVRRLYLLRQGPILGPLLQNHDDLSSVRTLFLHASLQDSVRFMLPNLFSFNSIGNLEEVRGFAVVLLFAEILCTAENLRLNWIWGLFRELYIEK